jgi:hypothetical protein
MCGAQYIKTWFFIDLIASLPLTYLAIIMKVFFTSTDNEGGIRIMKSIRIIRLAKMLRVARLKRIVGRHGSLVQFTAYMNSLFTFIAILYAAHVLSCAWYWVGNTADGWVQAGEIHNLTAAPESKFARPTVYLFALGCVCA